ncbi:hypothetical protein GZH53_05930 [Flavihumibacter sp. R14]|nr:hypothetical protein [Flavihumibacter soli]
METEREVNPKELWTKSIFDTLQQKSILLAGFHCSLATKASPNIDIIGFHLLFSTHFPPYYPVFNPLLDSQHQCLLLDVSDLLDQIVGIRMK